MHKHPLFPTNLSNFLYRLNRPNFIINKHGRNQQSISGYPPDNFTGVNNSLLVDRYIADFESFVFKVSASIKNTLVLGLRGYNVVLSSAVESC
jgi:hypothetical protein